MAQPLNQSAQKIPNRLSLRQPATQKKNNLNSPTPTYPKKRFNTTKAKGNGPMQPHVSTIDGVSRTSKPGAPVNRTLLSASHYNPYVRSSYQTLKSHTPIKQSDSQLQF